MTYEKYRSLGQFIYRDIIAIRSIGVLPSRFKKFEACLFNFEFTHYILYLFNYCSIHLMTRILWPYLNMHTEHFCYEIYCFANTPYIMSTYDQTVEYSRRVENGSVEEERDESDSIVIFDVPNHQYGIYYCFVIYMHIILMTFIFYYFFID